MPAFLQLPFRIFRCDSDSELFNQKVAQATTRFAALPVPVAPMHTWKTVQRPLGACWAPRLSWSSWMSSWWRNPVGLVQWMRCCWRKPWELTWSRASPSCPIMTTGRLGLKWTEHVGLFLDPKSLRRLGLSSHPRNHGALGAQGPESPSVSLQPREPLVAHGPGPAPPQLCGSHAGELRATPQATGSDLLPDAVPKEVRPWHLRMSVYITIIYIYYIHTYIPTYIHTFIPTYIHSFIHPSIHPFHPLHPYIHTSIHPYIHPSIHTYIYIYIGVWGI